MTKSKRAIATILAIVLCISCMAAMSACRVKDETILTFTSNDKSFEIKAGIYLCNLVQSYADFRSEYGEQIASASATTGIEFNYEDQTLEQKDYTTWIKDKCYQLCAEYAFVELEFDRLGLSLNDTQIDTADQYASLYWATGNQSIYEANGVSYASYKNYFTNQQMKLPMIFDYYYAEATDDEKKADSVKGSLRPSDSEIKENLKENYVVADTIQTSLTTTEENSSNVISLTDDEKKAAKSKLQAYADRLNNGESFSKIYIEYNGNDKTTDSTDTTTQPKDKYAEVFGGAETSNPSDYFDDIAKQTVGNAVVLEFADCYLLTVRQDILSDSYYFDNLKETCVQTMKYEEFTADITAKAKELESTKNDDAIGYYTPQKVKLEYGTQVAETSTTVA